MSHRGSLHWLAGACLVAGGPSLAAAIAVVPNQGSATLSIVDVSTDRVVSEIPAGTSPRGTVVSLDGRTAYVSDAPSRSLVVIDIPGRKTLASIEVGDSPEGVDISADGRWVAVAVEESNDVVFVDTRDNSKAHVVHVPGKNPLEDQQLSGLVMWIPAGVAYVVAGLALALRWAGLRSSDRRQGEPPPRGPEATTALP